MSKRLLKQIKIVGSSTQFEHVGCQEALHTIRNILTTRRHHGKETYVLLVNLVKAFDTVDHEVLFQILAKYRIPPPLITVLKKMYKDCKINKQKGGLTRKPTQFKVNTVDTNLTQALFTHLAKFGLKMHVGTAAEKSKFVAMHFPATLNEMQEQKQKQKQKLPSRHGAQQ